MKKKTPHGAPDSLRYGASWGDPFINSWALSIVTVVEDAERDYPLIHVTEAELNASIANIRLSRTAYLPRVVGLHNSIGLPGTMFFGALLPQNAVPSMSGPVIGSDDQQVGLGKRRRISSQLAAIRLRSASCERGHCDCCQGSRSGKRKTDPTGSRNRRRGRRTSDGGGCRTGETSSASGGGQLGDASAKCSCADFSPATPAGADECRELKLGKSPGQHPTCTG